MPTNYYDDQPPEGVDDVTQELPGVEDSVDLNKVPDPTLPPPKVEPNALTDTSPMPFGRYKGMAMHDIPTDYLHWFYHTTKMHYGTGLRVALYCEKNIGALRKENRDLIWHLINRK